jgi:hypothetical protein
MLAVQSHPDGAGVACVVEPVRTPVPLRKARPTVLTVSPKEFVGLTFLPRWGSRIPRLSPFISVMRVATTVRSP